VYLGEGVSLENEADMLPDEDLVPNIDPPKGRPDQDWRDDGVHFPLSLPDCAQTSVTLDLTVVSGTGPWFLNAWFDFSRDGDWEDTLTCSDPQRGQVTVPEWAIQNHAVSPAPGVHTVVSPLFEAHHPTGYSGEEWLRVTVSEAPAVPPGDGRGPDSGFAVGETEDYRLLSTGSESFSPGMEQ
jgi:hypothetical protein